MTQLPEEQYKMPDGENKEPATLTVATTEDLFSVLPREEKNNVSAENSDMIKTLPEEEKIKDLSSLQPLSPLPDTVENEMVPECSAVKEEAEERVMEKTPLLPVEEEEIKKEEVRNAPETSVQEKKTGEKKIITLRNLTNCTLGELLAAARNEQNMTIEEVSAVTLIRQDYIRALEADAHNELPPIIFIKAYVRALRALYNLDEDSAKMLQEQLAGIENPADVPEKVVDELNKNVQINEEEARKVRLTGYYLLGSLAAIFILTVALVIYFAAIRGKNVQEEKEGSRIEKTETALSGKNSEFAPEKISTLIAPVIAEDPQLPLPKAKRRSR